MRKLSKGHYYCVPHSVPSLVSISKILWYLLVYRGFILRQLWILFFRKCCAAELKDYSILINPKWPCMLTKDVWHTSVFSSQSRFAATISNNLSWFNNVTKIGYFSQVWSFRGDLIGPLTPQRAMIFRESELQTDDKSRPQGRF